METGRVVFLNQVSQLAIPLSHLFGRRLAGLLEIPLSFVFLERHIGWCSPSTCPHVADHCLLSHVPSRDRQEASCPLLRPTQPRNAYQGNRSNRRKRNQ